jgi:uncharacterized protein
MTRQTVAVVGAGVSGLTAAYLLSRTHAVTLYEAEPRLGGHAHTHDVTDSRGQQHAVDSGFIVLNDRTYPLLNRLLRELGVAVRPTEMSMSIRDEATGLEYAGGRGAGGVFAQAGRVADASFWAVLAQVRRFHRRAAAFLAGTDDTDQTRYGDFLHGEGFTDDFVRLYAVPVVSCVWSMRSSAALGYPARYLLRFLDHHGMLGLTGSPQWYTVVGGSRTYVDRIAATLTDVRSGLPARVIARDVAGASVLDASGEWTQFDRVVVATHADQALHLLADATPGEKELLGAFAYTANEAVLHTDASVLPAAPRARASWDYLTPEATHGDQPPVVTYWMNKLQGVHSAEQYLVTLNGAEWIDPDRVVGVMRYEHPVYDLTAVEAQRRLPELGSRTTVYAGAYHGWGFHEDGCRSGVEAARWFGVTW